MSHNRVSQVCLTASTVKIFIETMILIAEKGLWEEVQAYLKENGKTDMFVDYEVFFLVREMIENDSRFEEDDRLFRILRDHDDHDLDRYRKPSSTQTSA